MPANPSTKPEGNSPFLSKYFLSPGRSLVLNLGKELSIILVTKCFTNGFRKRSITASANCISSS